MIEDVCIVNGSWVALTNWYPPETNPVRIGEYEISFFDCGWQYETRAFWNGSMWLDKEGGNSLMNQAQTWRGLMERAA